MNFLNLTEENRKALYKLLSEKDYKTLAKKENLQKQFIYKFKENLDKVSYTKIHEYVEEHCFDEDEIVKMFNIALGAKIVDRYPTAKDVAEIIDSTAYEALSDEQKNKLETYRDSYDESKMPIAFDDFIKLNCFPNKQEEIRILVEKATREIMNEKDKVVKELEKTKQQLVESKQNYKQAIEDKRKIDNDNKVQLKQIRLFEKRFSLDNVITNLNKVLKANFEEYSFEAVYSKLNDLEDQYLKEKKYEDEMEVLAAKYALVKLLKEAK